MKRTLLALAGIAGISFAGAAGAASNPQTVVTGDVTANTVWSGEILLRTSVFVTNGATLTIAPGTIIRGEPRQNADATVDIPGALIVSADGRIVAQGSAQNPIIFTTAALDNNGDGAPDDVDGNPGFFDPWNSTSDTFLDSNPLAQPLSPLDSNGAANLSLWGGVVILGNAPTNLAAGPGAGYGRGQVEGLAVPGQFAPELAQYGGIDPHDSSGIFRFVSIRHAGDEIDEGNELNGLTLGGVGDGTVIENIEIYCNFDDGLEIFGGTVDTRNMVATFIGDDSFDMDQGHTGNHQFLLAVMPFFDTESGSAFGSASGDKGCECDGDDYRPGGGVTAPENVNVRRSQDGAQLDPTPWPFSSVNFYNMTIIGSTPPAPVFPPVDANSANRGIQMRNGFGGAVFNSIVVNTGSAVMFDVVDGDGAPPGFQTETDNAPAGRVSLVSSTLFNTGSGGLGGAAATAIANGDAIAANVGGSPNFVNGSFAGLRNADQTFPLKGIAGTGKLGAGLKPVALDPRPLNPIETVGGVPPQGPGLDETATFRGAFSRTAPTLWTTGWTVLNTGGVLAD
jgi:hypothetical protein